MENYWHSLPSFDITHSLGETNKLAAMDPLEFMTHYPQGLVLTNFSRGSRGKTSQTAKVFHGHLQKGIACMYTGKGLEISSIVLSPNIRYNSIDRMTIPRNNGSLGNDNPSGNNSNTTWFAQSAKGEFLTIDRRGFLIGQKNKDNINPIEQSNLMSSLAPNDFLIYSGQEGNSPNAKTSNEILLANCLQGKPVRLLVYRGPNYAEAWLYYLTFSSHKWLDADNQAFYFSPLVPPMVNSDVVVNSNKSLSNHYNVAVNRNQNNYIIPINNVTINQDNNNDNTTEITIKIKVPIQTRKIKLVFE